MGTEEITNYPTETAGKLMTRKVPMVNHEVSVGDVLDYIIKNADDFDTVNYVYVLSHDGKLEGVVSIKQVLKSDKNTVIRELIKNKDVIKVHVHTEQRRVALTVLKHGIKSVPVVDKDEKFMGVVPTDVILKIIDIEAVEDVFRFGGLLHKGSIDDVMKLPVPKSLLHRLPWLIIGLVGGMLSAQIIELFDDTINKSVLIAAFIPMVVYMADAVSTQIEVIVVRDLAFPTPDLIVFSSILHSMRNISQP